MRIRMDIKIKIAILFYSL
jgi:hypothetical protein